MASQSVLRQQLFTTTRINNYRNIKEDQNFEKQNTSHIHLLIS